MIVSTTDPVTYLSVSAILAAIAMMACYTVTFPHAALCVSSRCRRCDPSKAIRTGSPTTNPIGRLGKVDNTTTDGFLPAKPSTAPAPSYLT